MNLRGFLLNANKHGVWIKMLLIGLYLALDAPPIFSQEDLMTKEEALLIAEGTEEVQGLYGLRHPQAGLLKKDCIEKKVLKTCETDWVTCIEDAWLVEFNVVESCVGGHDGRLTVKVLVDAKTKAIISRFPEAPYFRSAQYCLEDYDCFSVSDKKQQISCSNFIFAQVSGKDILAENNCACQDSKCIIHPPFGSSKSLNN